MKRLALAVALLIGLATPSQAGHQAAGAAAYSRGDYATALQEFKRLAERGSAIAQKMLGVMYGKGQGVPQDYVRAHMWFDLAASHLPPGHPRRDLVIKDREAVAALMTPAQIAEAQRLAREWMEKRRGK